MAGKWTCPYCNSKCILQDSNLAAFKTRSYATGYGTLYLSGKLVVCPNEECNRYSFRVSLKDDGSISNRSVHHEWQLLPDSESKPFPDYIPQALREDYLEACLIKNQSPKASATLARRCLQGMIRDFWGISKSRLVDEIAALEDKVDPQTWEAIDSVRHVGNIGAHMEKDVNLIIEVSPDEAGLLIWLIETLFEDWYINRFERQQRMARIKGIADKKKQQKRGEPNVDNSSQVSAKTLLGGDA